MKLSLINKHAIVCGSTDGIGKASAILLAKQGCEITLVARNQNKLNNLAIRLDIIDDGPGIPSEIESGAFFPMVTGNAEGTGLGLSIAQQLVQSQSGTITYERKNNNTYFSVFLPIEESNE